MPEDMLEEATQEARYDAFVRGELSEEEYFGYREPQHEPECAHRNMRAFCPDCGISADARRNDTARFWGRLSINDHWGDHDNVYDYGLD